MERGIRLTRMMARARPHGGANVVVNGVRLPLYQQVVRGVLFT